MRRVSAALALCLFASTAMAQVSRPNATATPQLDPAKIAGIPRPTLVPNCQDGSVGLHGYAGDLCLYACASYTRQTLAGSGCALPTNAATATVSPTPTRTATPTPTLTATLTPTPMVTATP